MRVNCNIEIPPEEQQAYVDYAMQKYPDRKITELNITIGDDGFVGLKTVFEPDNFWRIRRITGYLVGTLDRFNNGKRAEEADRVKHTITD